MDNSKKAHIIVVSNEKGGTGKSTISMHLAIKLLQEGFSVATIDMEKFWRFSIYLDREPPPDISKTARTSAKKTNWLCRFPFITSLSRRKIIR